MSLFMVRHKDFRPKASWYTSSTIIMWVRNFLKPLKMSVLPSWRQLVADVPPSKVENNLCSTRQTVLYWGQPWRDRVHHVWIFSCATMPSWADTGNWQLVYATSSWHVTCMCKAVWGVMPFLWELTWWPFSRVSTSGAGYPGITPLLSEGESHQWHTHWYSSGYLARCLAVTHFW